MKSRWLALVPICLALSATQSTKSPLLLASYVIIDKDPFPNYPPIVFFLARLLIAVGFLAAGFLCDRMGARRVLLIGVACWVASTIARMLIGRFDFELGEVETICGAFTSVAGIVLIAQLFRGRERLFALGAFFSAIPLAGVVTRLAFLSIRADDVIEHLKYVMFLAQVAAVGVALVSLIWLFFVKPSAQLGEDSPGQAKVGFAPWQWVSALALATVTFYAYFAGEWQYQTWRPYVILAGGGRYWESFSKDIALLMTWYPLVSFAGTLIIAIVGWKAKRLHPAMIVVFCLTGGTIACYGIGNYPAIEWLTALYCVFAACLYAALGPMWSTLLQLAPELHRGLTVGALSSLQALVFLYAGGLGGGGHAEDFVPNTLHWTMTAFMVGAAAMAALQILLTVQRRQSATMVEA